MRITQEADYALRICATLAQAKAPMGTPQLSESLCISPRFAAKILRKLSLKGIVRATRGINGGFTLAFPPADLTLKNVIEAIDGEILIRHCLSEGFSCTFQKNKAVCRFHAVFDELNTLIRAMLDKITLADMINSDVSAKELVNQLHIL